MRYCSGIIGNCFRSSMESADKKVARTCATYHAMRPIRHGSPSIPVQREGAKVLWVPERLRTLWQSELLKTLAKVYAKRSASSTISAARQLVHNCRQSIAVAMLSLRPHTMRSPTDRVSLWRVTSSGLPGARARRLFERNQSDYFDRMAYEDNRPRPRLGLAYEADHSDML